MQMTEFATPQAGALLAEAEWLRRLSRRLVAGADRADDLCQDTLLVALQHPIKNGTWRPWLSRVARRLAGRSSDADRRRRVREQDAARAEAEPAAADIVEQVTVQRSVVDAVLALPEPYRSTILLRFWDDLKPRHIAARTGVPVETVRTRLKRGQAMLREHLDDTHGSRAAWCTPLLALPGARAAAAAAHPVIATSALTGVLWMKTKLTILLFAAACACLLTWSAWPETESAPSTVEGTAHTASGSAAPVANVTDDGPSRDALPTGATPQLRADHVVIRGRLVDSTASPLSGARVAMRATSARGEISTNELPTEQITGRDGTFEVRFAPVTERGYVLRATAHRKVSLRCRYAQLEPGQVHDLGDVVMTNGCIVSGRLLDEDGVPHGNVPVRLFCGNTETAEPGPERTRRTTTLDDGTFAFPHALQPGTWIVHLDGLRLVERRNEEIGADDATRYLDLECLAPRETLHGTVVDDRGVPVEGASVRVASTRILLKGDDAGNTGPDGRFRLVRMPEDGDRVALIVQAPEFEDLHTRPVHTWGRDDIELRLQPRGRVQLVVIDGATNEPVEAFGVRWMSTGTNAPGTNSWSRRFGGTHEGGRLWLSGAARGPQLLRVEPEGEDYGPSPIVRFVLPRTQPVRVELHRPAERDVLVVDPDGQPIRGSRVELLHRHGAPVSPGSRAVSPTSPMVATPDAALLLGEAETDQEGRAMLRGAPARGLTLRVSGEQHPLVIVRDFELADGLDAARVVIEAAATLAGVVRPADVLADLAPDPKAGAAAHAGHPLMQQILAAQRPGLRLQSRDDPRKQLPPDQTQFAVEADGSFRIDAIPPGTWDVMFAYKMPGERNNSKLHEPLATVTLRAGETRKIDLDISRAQPATLVGTVTLADEPVAHRSIELVMLGANVFWGNLRVAEQQMAVETDGAGQFKARVPPAEWTVRIAPPDAQHNDLRWIYSDDKVVIGPGQQVVQHFGCEHRQLEVRLVDAAGKPSANRVFQVWRGRRLGPSFRTDASGVLTVDPVPAEPFDLVTWPRELLGQKEQTNYIREHPYPEWTQVLIRIGPIAPQDGEIELADKRL